MLNISLICIGNLKEKYWAQAVEEYSKRLSAFCRFSVIQLNEERISNNPSPGEIDRILNAEGKRILEKIPKNSYVISMCIEGKQISSNELSQKIEDISLSGKSSLCFIIGGSRGLSQQVKQRSDFKLSMSKMTFPHQMARVILCEQIYRAFEISSNGKYHK
ncbi:MAG: 23S rRNA (pseudouridine(1915)-N(3))-methyltransferase RlmH [bacterium]|nr:23S rRNA (pseudouridine(1915)-N(3))-methyltransferase RlmH [bacterium]MDD6225484.1 23S rRNA (pseudouridine(1915)-N(3))-methyltransferase RlmH [bacterium]